jgi:hypothetical protein
MEDGRLKMEGGTRAPTILLRQHSIERQKVLGCGEAGR